MADYVVTGVAGFIGAALTERLLSDGHFVYGVDSMDDAYDVRLKQRRIRKLLGNDGLSKRRFEWVCTDLCNSSWYPIRLRNVDAVIHLAGRAGVRSSIIRPDAHAHSNIQATIDVLEAVRCYKVPKLIFASSSSVYSGGNYAHKENDDTNWPSSPYAATKKAAEGLIASYQHLYGFSARILRYFSVYGPAGRPDTAVFRFIQAIVEGRPIRLFGDATQSRRDFTYIDDIVDGTVRAINASAERSHIRDLRIINLGAGVTVRLSDLIQIIERKTGRTAIIEPHPANRADVDTTWASNLAAQSGLGWKPSVCIESGISRTVDWYLENREWAKDISTVDYGG